MIGQVVGGGRFRIDGPLKQGGMGSLYRATDLERGEPCVVKELDIGKIADFKVLELFEREIAVLKALDHPQIPKLRGHFTIEGEGSVRVFLVQDLVPGADLEETRASGRLFATEEVMRIGRQLVDVLIYMHRRRPPIIHRDVKPRNIVLRPDGVPVLVDFGAVRNTVVDAAVGGATVVGTFGYMAPEQLRGHAEPASDVYALGATLLFMLTGRDPSDFDHEALKLDLRKDSGLSEPVVQLLEAMLEPAVEVRKSMMPQLVRGFDRVQRGSLPFLPEDGKVSADATARASVDGRNRELPPEVKDILSPEIVQLADDLRDLQITLERAQHKLTEADKGVSFLDRLNFLHDTPAELKVKALKAEQAGLQKQLKELEGQFSEAVERRAMMNPVFAMRGQLEAVQRALARVETDDGESSRSRSCSVYHLSEVLDALKRAEALFRDYAGVRHDFEELSSRIGQAAREGSPKARERAVKGLDTLEREIVGRAIEHLASRGYAQATAEVERLEAAHGALDAQKDKARSQVKMLDWINFFSDSPEEVKLKALSNQLGGVYRELSDARRHMQDLYRSTLESEALLNALFTLAGARSAVDQIRARPEERTHTERRTRPDGTVKYTERRYWVCTLEGVEEARRRARTMEGEVMEVLGRPLTLEELKAIVLREA